MESCLYLTTKETKESKKLIRVFRGFRCGKGKCSGEALRRLYYFTSKDTKGSKKSINDRLTLDYMGINVNNNVNVR